MKRFITYLYEYRDGKKAKNVGFIRVDIRGTLVNMEICIKNYMRADAIGKCYGLIRTENIQAIEWGDIHLHGGQCNQKIVLEETNRENEKYTITDVLGVAVIFDEDGYLASCWKDEGVDEIARGDFTIYRKEKEEDVIEAAEELEEVRVCQRENEEIMPPEREIISPQKEIRYKKIESEQIHELPSSNWHFSENSFLKHGVFNYGFLFLKTEVDNGEMHMSLGVPGYYEKQELLMAMLFGFPEFEPIPKEIVDMEMNLEKGLPNIEKNQDPKTGVFGGWFVLLDK